MEHWYFSLKAQLLLLKCVKHINRPNFKVKEEEMHLVFMKQEGTKASFGSFSFHKHILHTYDLYSVCHTIRSCAGKVGHRKQAGNRAWRLDNSYLQIDSALNRVRGRKLEVQVVFYSSNCLSTVWHNREITYFSLNDSRFALVSLKMEYQSCAEGLNALTLVWLRQIRKAGSN